MTEGNGRAGAGAFACMGHPVRPGGDRSELALNVLDLFAGLRGWSDPWKARGHTVVTLDFDPKFGTDLVADILTVDVAQVRAAFGGARPDVVLASPPCEGFTVMNIGKNWTHEGEPKTARAAMALEIATAAVRLIGELDPWFWVLENPVGKLRSLHLMDPFERHQVTYCQYGESHRRKPTDLWGGFPPSWRARPACGHHDPARGVVWPCHPYTKRGESGHGTQQAGVSPEERARIPDELSLSVCLAAEQDIAVALRWQDRVRQPQRYLPRPLAAPAGATLWEGDTA